VDGSGRRASGWAACWAQWPLVAAALWRANLALLLLVVATFLLTNWVKAVCWRLLFYPEQGKLRTARCHSILHIGQLANSVLPLRLGELSRAYLLGEREGVSKALALATAVVEKAMDSVKLLLLMAALAPWVPLPPWLRRSSLILSAALATGLVALIWVASQPERIMAALNTCSQRHPALTPLRIANRLVEASARLQAVRVTGVQLRLWGLSLWIWALALMAENRVLGGRSARSQGPDS